MKKLLSIISLMAINTTCFAIANFDGSTGTLVMRDVSVESAELSDDGSTVYDRVTLKLNLDNNTFSILDAILKEKDNPFSVYPQATTALPGGIMVDFHGCILSGPNQITCMTKVISLSKDQLIIVPGGISSKLFDNLSKEYAVSTIAALDQTGSVSLNCNAILGIPVEVKFIYNNIDPAATSISAFEPNFKFSVEGHSLIGIASFRDIILKIEAIEKK